MKRTTFHRFGVFLVYGLALLLCAYAVSCSMLGSTGGGAVAGGAIAGPTGAAAGAAGGLIGYGWTSIVAWWQGFWGGLFGDEPTPQQVQTVLHTMTVVKWVAAFAVLVVVTKALLGPRYRELLLAFLLSVWKSLLAFVTLKFGAGAAAAKEAASKAAQAAGMKHSR